MKKIIWILLLILWASCANNSEQQSSVSVDEVQVDKEEFSIDETAEDIKNDDNEVDSECRLEDGTYSASVDYTNPSTGYSQTYSLDVEVVDCQVVQINFPNGGWLDESHISAADIDENGDASVDGEEGKTYQVHIDN
ncbi:MAG TPA: hypothetical protein PLH61_13685 [Bacteroidia bacterium]|nr:hypothetical protein [Bacteroidia bacterium]